MSNSLRPIFVNIIEEDFKETLFFKKEIMESASQIFYSSELKPPLEVFFSIFSQQRTSPKDEHYNSLPLQIVQYFIISPKDSMIKNQSHILSLIKILRTCFNFNQYEFITDQKDTLDKDQSVKQSDKIYFNAYFFKQYEREACIILFPISLMLDQINLMLTIRQSSIEQKLKQEQIMVLESIKQMARNYQKHGITINIALFSLQINQISISVGKYQFNVGIQKVNHQHELADLSIQCFQLAMTQYIFKQILHVLTHQTTHAFFSLRYSIKNTQLIFENIEDIKTSILSLSISNLISFIRIANEEFNLSVNLSNHILHEEPSLFVRKTQTSYLQNMKQVVAFIMTNKPSSERSDHCIGKLLIKFVEEDSEIKLQSIFKSMILMIEKSKVSLISD